MTHDDREHARSLGVAVALGAAMGAAGGAVTGHVGVWVAAGILAYLAFTFFSGSWKRDRT